MDEGSILLGVHLVNRVVDQVYNLDEPDYRQNSNYCSQQVYNHWYILPFLSMDLSLP